jgi:hypothetical protein
VALANSERAEHLEVSGPTGTRYGVEVQFLWDDKEKQTIRILGSIDDGGLRAFFPMTESLLISPPTGAKT